MTTKDLRRKQSRLSSRIRRNMRLWLTSKPRRCSSAVILRYPYAGHCRAILLELMRSSMANGRGRGGVRQR